MILLSFFINAINYFPYYLPLFFPSEFSRCILLISKEKLDKMKKQLFSVSEVKLYYFTISLYMGYLCFSSHENLTLKEAKNTSLFVQR